MSLGAEMSLTIARKLRFKVVLPEHGINRAAYEAPRDSFIRLRNLRRQDTPIPPGTLTRPIAANVQPYCFRQISSSVLGRGAHGKVTLVSDASTGKTYVAKEHHVKFLNHEANVLKKLRHVRDYLPVHCCADTDSFH